MYNAKDDRRTATPRQQLTRQPSYMARSTGSLRPATIPPSIPEAYLPRNALFTRMRDFLERRLILIQAPPGYGKSTLVAGFCQEVDQPACWLRLSAADQDVVRLANLMTVSLTGRFHRLRGRLDLEHPPGSTAQSLATGIAEGVQEAVPEPFLIVLDDVQWINRSEPAVEFLDLLLKALPESVTFVIASREIPRISLPSLVMDGEVGGLGPLDLALEEQELAELVQGKLDLDLDLPSLQDLHRRTGGWIMGALLFAIDPERNARASFLPDYKGPTSFFAEAVVAQVSEELREFMLESAVLPKMTAQSCDAVLERPDSEARLGELMRRGYFITAIQTEPRSYEYHPLFRSSLIEIMELGDPERLQHLRHQAAEHFADEGAVEDAFELYTSAGSMEAAARLAEESAQDLFSQGRLTTLKSWAGSLHEARVDSPNLLLTVATLSCDLGQFEEAETWLSRAAVPFDPGEADPDLLARARYVEGHLALQRGEPALALRMGEEVQSLLPPEQDPQVLRRSAALRLRAMAMYQLGEDLEQAERLAQQATELLNGTEHRYTYAQALMDRATIHIARGRGLEAYEASQRAHEELLELEAPLPLTISFNNLANLAHAHGRYNEALDLFEEAIKHARRAGSLRYEASVLLGQGDVFNDLGLRFQAGDLYGEGLRTARRVGVSSLVGYGYLQTCQLHRRAGNTDLARDWLEQAAEQAGPYTGEETLEMHAAALQIGEDAAQARTRLERLGDRTEVGLTAQNRTLLAYCLALATLVEAGEQAAAEPLRKALDTADRQGTLQVLAGELSHDERLLILAQTAFPEDPLVDQLQHRLDFMRLVRRSYERRSEPHIYEDVNLLVNALGSGVIRFEGQQVTDLPPLPRQLLFYLVDKQPVARDHILETFWPEVDPERQVSSLYTAVHTIRRKLGDRAVDIDGSLYYLYPNWSIRYDALEFERSAHIAQAVPKGDPRRPFALDETISSYQGSFLPEFAENWVLERRRELEALLLDLLTDHAEAAEAAGQLERAAHSLQRSLSIDPLRDDLHLRYMEALADLGRRSEIITHYHKYVRRLDSELGVEPPPEARRFYQEQIG